MTQCSHEAQQLRKPGITLLGIEQGSQNSVFVSQVENKSISAISIKQHGMPFTGSRAFMGPSIREGHTISFTFQMPSLLEEYRKKAEDYWGHVLGHEGPGSLLSALKARRWATGLAAGAASAHFSPAQFSYLPASVVMFGVHHFAVRNSATGTATCGTEW